MLSAGVGRTGTFIAIDNILEQIEEQKMVDIPKVITKIRQRRMKMVQTQVRVLDIHFLVIALYLILQAGNIIFLCRISSHLSMMSS